MVSQNGTAVVIDAGPDFRYQMLREGVDDIDAIVFTHGHKDHTGGLDDVRAFNYVNKKSVDIYANAETMVTIRKDYDYAFAEHPYPGVPELTPHVITGDEYFTVGCMTFIPVKGCHFMMEVLGYRIGPLGYITDMNRIEENEADKLKGVDILIINALRHEKHLSHFSLDEALEVIEAVKPRQAFLTHISHQMGLHRDVAAELPAGVAPAYDGMTIEIPDVSVKPNML